MGDKANNSFPIKVSLLAGEKCQIRHTALEAARITANRHLTADTGKMGFYMKLRVYPHEVLRENKQATGAGADRVSSGMRGAFGKNVGTAARVNTMPKIFTVAVEKQNFEAAKKALWHAGQKLPTPCRIVVDQGAELVQ
jgi:large subunit ribosomal protein L10e